MRESPDVRVGLAAGRVMPKLGDVFGNTVNRASRLTAIAHPGSVLADEAVAESLHDVSGFALDPLRPRTLRGVGKVEPFLLTRAGARPTAGRHPRPTGGPVTDTGTLVRIEADGEGHVVEIVLDRPEALNAVSTAMADGARGATARVAADPNVRCVVLRSSQERAFCVGADLKERNAFTDADLVRQRPVARGAYRGVLDLPVPAIAAVEGYALGGGYELALVLRPHRGRGDRDRRAARGLASASSPAAAAPSC